MFSWFRKSPRPPRPVKQNPGLGHTARVAFANSQRSWEESDDLAISLAETLNAMGHKAAVNRDWVDLDGGFSLLPQIVSVQPLDNSGVKTLTTLQISHASLVPQGIFDFQHSSGDDLRDSLRKGFKSWAELDLPVFLDAMRASATSCMVMEMKPGSESTSMLQRDRRVLFGPPLQMAQNSAPLPGDHDFCPCCLFTNSIAAFEDLVRAQDFYGVRMFVSRDAEGVIQADCRVNGIDHPAGAAALATYAKAWPSRGFEYRKQFVGIQTREPAK